MISVAVFAIFVSLDIIPKEYERNCLYELGDFYKEGIIVERNLRKAFYLYILSYKMIMEYYVNSPDFFDDCYMDVCLRLAECYQSGWGTNVDSRKAKKFIEIAKGECERRISMGDTYGAVYQNRILGVKNSVDEALKKNGLYG